MLKLAKSFISHYNFEYDDRQPNFLVEIPSVGASIGFTNMSLIFWLQCLVWLCFQSLINVCLALFVYKFIVQQSDKTTARLIGYGLVCPVLLCGPLYVLRELEFHNITFILCLVGVPNLLLLRVIEAMHGMTPSFAKDSVGMFAVYFSSTLQVKLDPKTNRPEAFTSETLDSKLGPTGLPTIYAIRFQVNNRLDPTSVCVESHYHRHDQNPSNRLFVLRI